MILVLAMNASYLAMEYWESGLGSGTTSLSFRFSMSSESS